jgi:hypothetical protein
MLINSQNCPCGSGIKARDCCLHYFSLLGIPLESRRETTLQGWHRKYSDPISTAFMNKVEKYVFRISHYLDFIVDFYFPIGFTCLHIENEKFDEVIMSVKNNILNSILGAFTCLSKGLFLQNGILLRSSIEDCFVILDIFENNEQTNRFIKNKYSTNGLVSRVKKHLPLLAIRWYGYFSDNFTHFGPAHSACIMPRACYADNWIIVTGLQDIVRGIIVLHLVMEKVYLRFVERPLFWKVQQGHVALSFDENSVVFQWFEKLGKEIVAQYPPGERKSGIFYSRDPINLK